MVRFRTSSLALAAVLAATSTLAASAQAPADPQIVGEELPAQAPAGELARACGVVHQEGRSACTHDRVRSRMTILAWWGADAADSQLTPEDERELDALLGSGRPIHDQLNSMFLRIAPPTPGDLRGCPDAPPVPGVAARKPRHTLRRTNREFDIPCPKF